MSSDANTCWTEKFNIYQTYYVPYPDRPKLKDNEEFIEDWPVEVCCPALGEFSNLVGVRNIEWRENGWSWRIGLKKPLLINHRPEKFCDLSDMDRMFIAHQLVFNPSNVAYAEEVGGFWYKYECLEDIDFGDMVAILSDFDTTGVF